jgi:hypothetical protein
VVGGTLKPASSSKAPTPDAVSAKSILLPPSYQQPLTPFDTLIRPPHPAAEIGKSRTSPVNGGVHSAHEPHNGPFSLSLSLSLSLAGFAVPYPTPWFVTESWPRASLVVLILRELRVSCRSLAGSLESSVKICIAKEAPEVVEHTCVRLHLA